MIPVNVLAVRYLANASPMLAQALGAPKGYPALVMLTTDCDDATYIALDEATKAAEVEVAYGRSFYAGAANASTPNAGEVIGILAGRTPGAVRSGMEAALAALENLGFEQMNNVPYLAHTVASAGSFLSSETMLSFFCIVKACPCRLKIRKTSPFLITSLISLDSKIELMSTPYCLLMEYKVSFLFTSCKINTDVSLLMSSFVSMF